MPLCLECEVEEDSQLKKGFSRLVLRLDAVQISLRLGMATGRVPTKFALLISEPNNTWTHLKSDYKINPKFQTRSTFKLVYLAGTQIRLIILLWDGLFGYLNPPGNSKG